MTGNELKKAIKDFGKTQKEASEYLGMSLRVVQKYCGLGDEAVPKVVSMSIKTWVKG